MTRLNKNSPSWCLPRRPDFSIDTVKSWFGNIKLELAMDIYDAEERANYQSYYNEAGLLKKWRLPFFWGHYAETLAEAARYLFKGRPDPLILDLGCGTGTQSLFFALNGAHVISVDLDKVALRILRKRKALYETLSGSPVHITILEENVLDLDYAAYGPFDGVYSLFAFNIMQPSSALVDRLLPHLSTGARWVVLDGNRASIWPKIFPWRRRNTWAPLEMRQELEAREFQVESQHGGVALPAFIWAVLPYRMVRLLNDHFRKSLFLSISCMTFAVKSEP